MSSGTSVWVTCRECGHVSRVLAVMASRVLAERQTCPSCHSSEAPTLNSTPSGTHILLSDDKRLELRYGVGEQKTVPHAFGNAASTDLSWWDRPVNWFAAKLMGERVKPPVHL